jgi:hypothetical protein
MINTSKKGRKPLAVPSVRIALWLPQEAVEQMDDLARVLHVRRSSVLSQAIARWYAAEQLVQGKKSGKKSNGHGNT